MARPSPPMAWLHWVLFRVLLTVLWVVPVWMFARIAAALGTGAYSLSRRYRVEARVNVRRAFPEEFPVSAAGPEAPDDPRLEAFLRRNYEYLFYSFMDVLLAPRQYRVSNWMRYTQFRIHPRAHELLTAPQQPGQPGFLFCGAHFGAWERLVHAFALLGYPTTIIVRPLDSYRVDADVEQMRRRHGNTTLSKFGAMREQMRLIREGRSLGIVPDQDAGVKGRGVFVRFFGQWCKSLDAPAVLAIHYQTPLIVQFSVRVGFTPNCVQFIEEPIETKGLDARNLADVTSVMQRYHDLLERYMRAFPEQYEWLHKKWRTRPWGEPGADERFIDQQPQARERSPYGGATRL